MKSILKTGEAISRTKRVQEIIVQMRFIDSYATSFFREQAVRILVENGIRVTAYGTGWDQCEWSDNPHLDYRRKSAGTGDPATHE